MSTALLALACVGGAVLTACGLVGVVIALSHCVLESRRRREAAAMAASGKSDAVQGKSPH
ncbi:MAG: hypothetical protein LUB63_05375 [Oscillospiraceae bacterium]|nr:hypothetical protein [Oscillospiraceae bacterium]